MNEKQMINRVKIFQGNCLLNGDKISFADACKVVLLSELVDNGRELNQKEVELLLLLIRKEEKWYKLW